MTRFIGYALLVAAGCGAAVAAVFLTHGWFLA